jgi:hypothetical protein
MMHLRKHFPGLVAAGLLLVCSSMSRAAIIFDVLPYDNVVIGERVLFNAPGLINSGTVVEGKTGQSNTMLQFASLRGEMLETRGSEYGVLDGQTDGRINMDFKINAENTGVGFDSVYLKVNAPTQATPLFQVIVEDFNGNIFRSSVMAGQDRASGLRIRGTDGQIIKSVSFDMQSGYLQDVQQMHVGVQAIPEASTVLSFAGLLGAGGLILKRARKQT